MIGNYIIVTSQKKGNYSTLSYDNLVFRLANTHDIDQLFYLSQATQPGLTSIPKSEKLWADRVKQNKDLLSKKDSLMQGKWFTFVIEDVSKNKIIGTASILDEVGKNYPLNVYQICEEKKTSSHLQIKQYIRYLNPKQIESGPSELGALWLHPKYRGFGLGRLLTVGRLMFIATHRKYFKQSILAEMRGYADEKGKVPFWEHVSKPIFGMSYEIADYLASKNQEFIKELLPNFPIIIDLLSNQARECIGMCHPLTTAACAVLLSEGFKMTRSVDIFDAGPKLTAQIDELRAIKNLNSLPIREMKVMNDFHKSHSKIWIVLDNSSKDFNLKVINAVKKNDCLWVEKGLMASSHLNENSYSALLLTPQQKDSFIQGFWSCYQNAASLFKTIG